MLATAILALIAGLLALAISSRAAFLATRSAPENLRLVVESLAAEIAQLASTSEGRDGKMIAWRAEIEGVMDGVEATLESVERKRKQTTAAAAKLGGNGAGQEPATIGDWERLARERGLL